MFRYINIVFVINQDKVQWVMQNCKEFIWKSLVLKTGLHLSTLCFIVSIASEGQSCSSCMNMNRDNDIICTSSVTCLRNGFKMCNMSLLKLYFQDWVPIIARDTQRQRRQNPQPPFSDAYQTGMPSKRRKIVTTAKPQGSLSQIIAGKTKWQ